MKIAIAQLDFTVGDFNHNKEKILKAYDEAVQNGAELVIFPELAITGYPPKDLLLKHAFVKESQKKLNEIVPHIQNAAAIIGFVEINKGNGKPFFNSAAFIRKGVIAKTARKILIPSYDVFDEDLYFEPGKKSIVLSHLHHRIGLSICEDIWNDKDYWRVSRYRRNPVKEQMEQDAHLLVNISSSPYHLGKQALRFNMLSAVARRNKTIVVYCNVVGANDELIFDGCSYVFDEHGSIIARGKSFQEDMLYADLHERTGIIHKALSEDAEALYHALVLGVKDYMRKCGFKDVVIGLSGGIDSSIVACIAAEALGASHVFGVSMPSRYSSKASITDAELLAKNLTIDFMVIDIDSIYQCYLNTMKPLFKGLPEDTTEQNIQARIRGNILMAISNKHNRMVLSTGNKSELAMGYCTLYGDMTGGLSMLADVPKTFIYKLAAYVNRDSKIIPQNIITKAPSAELKPNQTDQDDLPPYEFLDTILKMYIEEEKSLDEIVAMNYDRNIVKDILYKIDMNEFKRRQAPPGLKVTSRAFGMGRRIPIAQLFSKYMKETL